MNTKQRKAVIAIITVLIILAIGCAAKILATEDVDDLADTMVKLTEEEKIAKERDDNPEIIDYLVTDNCISRVLPNTTVSDFISNFRNEKIKVYNDRACQEEVTSGNVCSGMYAKYEINERIFEISVLGDINEKVEQQSEGTEPDILEEEIISKVLKGDSNLNEIECTRVIRTLLENENWKIEDEGEFKSADVTCNHEIEEQDINSIVHYIVFGEIEAPSVEKVESPSLKVSKGLKNEDGSFEGSAKVKLTQNAKNGTKNTYRILRYEEEYIEIANEDEIELTQPGTYTIIAYTYGEQGNKSKGELKTVIVTSGKYKLTLVAGENILSVKGAGDYKVGETVKIDATVKSDEPGYKYKWGGWISDNQEILANQAMKNSEITMPRENITLTAIATKEIVDYNIIYNLNGGELEKENPTTYTIESASITLNNPSKKEYKFIGWTGSNGDKPETTATIETGSTGDREYIANWKKLENVQYTVKHYKEDLTGSAYELAETEILSEKEGKKVDAIIKEYEGFTFDEENSDNILTGTVTEDGKLTLEVYYKRNTYTLTLDKNENVDEVTGAKTYKYEEKVEIDAILKEEQGYRFVFNVWESSNTTLLTNQTNKKSEFTMPAGDLTLTAMAIKYAREDTEYNIEYYYQEDGMYSSEPKYRVEGTGTTGTTKSISELEKQPTLAGYKFDDKNENNILEGIIEADGSLVLKVYFKQQFKVSYLTGKHGTFKPQTTQNLDYGSAMPKFEGEITHEEGYEFAGWDKEVLNTVTGNVEYTATWEETIYNIEYNLNGGELLEGVKNPTTYTVETESFTLNNPVKKGYRFIGWTGTELENKTQDVIVEKGSTGDRTYIANWETIEYTITYELNSGELLEGKTNPEKYTIETERFTLNNPIKVGYTFLGWTGTELEEVTENVTIASGSTGDREYIANWSKNKGVKYRVEYYVENMEGTAYDLQDSNELSGTTEEHVNIEIKEIKGFTFDSENENNKLEGNIAGDGSLVLKAYYNRNSYNLTLYTQKTNNIQKLILNDTEEEINNNENIRISKTFKFGTPIEIGAELEKTKGYTTTFTKWESSNIELIADQANKNVEFTMPAGDLILEAKATKVANLSNYTVEYYYEGEEGYEEMPTSSETRQKLTGEIAVIEESDKIPQKDGYEYDETAENKLTGTIVGDGSLVLKVYFRKSVYNLTIVAGDGITKITLDDLIAEEEKTLSRTFKYGESIAIDATCGEEVGYIIEFGKWKSNNIDLMEDNTTKNLQFTMPAGDLTLTAIANKNPLETTYRVEFYYQENGVYPSEAKKENIITRTGITGTMASVTSADKEAILPGYTYDNNAEGKIESTVISGDGSTILKVYFKQQFTVTYKPGEYGTFEESVINGIDYGVKVPNYTGSLEGSEGYIFDCWTPEIEEDTTVTENLVFVAQWKKMALPIIKHSPTTWTNQNVKVKIEKPEGYEKHNIEYSVANLDNWQEYTSEFEVEENCVVYARLIEGNNKGDVAEHTIDNIDKIAPEFAETNVNTESTDQAIITIRAIDNLSGIVEYGITGLNDASPTVYKCSNTNDTEVTFDEVYENGLYEVYLKDAAGNITTGTIPVIHIKQYNVAKIVSAPAGYEHLINTEYETLELALSASDEAAQIGNVKIEIIHNIHDEANTIQNGRDYTINLNNYYIKSQEEENTLTVDGKLRVVDENQAGTGAIINTFDTGIYISLDGELTLGEDDNQNPSQFSPIVQGLTYGIVKEIDYQAQKDPETGYYPEGVFNFYDGKIIGGTAAIKLQKINDTPTLYDPTIITNPVTGNQESTLAIVSGIEAVIGKKRYMLLEDAISDANNIIGDSNTQVEITLAKSITKEASIVIDETKNIKLDLNGKIFTTTANNYVLENYGRLEICDSTEKLDETTGEKIAGTGTITSSTNSTILNGISETTETAYEDIDLTKAKSNGEYYFDVRSEGGLISNNAGTESEARSYIEIDLTDKEGIYELVTNYTISSKKGYGFGYITVRDNTNSPEYNDVNARKVYVTGLYEDEENTFRLVGGKKYYIHIGYYKSMAAGAYSDCFIIKNMKIGKKQSAGELVITSGTFECTKAGTNASTNCCSVIENESRLYVNGGTIQADQNYTVGISNAKNSGAAYLEINDGKINTFYNSVFNMNSAIAIVNGGDISYTYYNENGALNNQAYLYVLGKDVNINGRVGIYNFNAGISVVENGNITAIIYGIYNASTIDVYDNVIIKGGEIATSSGHAVYNRNTGKIKIENVTITLANSAIYNNNSGIVEIDNIEISSFDTNGMPTVYNGLLNYRNGKIILNGGNIHVKDVAGYNYGYGSGTGTIEMNGGLLKSYNTNYGTVRNINSNPGIFKMTGGTIIGTKIGIDIRNASNIIITGGTIETTSENSCAISNEEYGIITIGSNDKNVSTEDPVIKGKLNAVINGVGTFNFYDGVLIGSENNVIKGILTNIPDEYELVKEIKEDELQYVTLGIPTYYVAKIAESDKPNVSNLDSSYYKLEDGYYYFVTLNSAVEACNIENKSTIELIDNQWVYKKITVDQGQDITIKFNDKTIYLYATLNFENNGNLTLTNTTEGTSGKLDSKGQQLVKNNVNAEVNIENIAINHLTGTGNSHNYRNLMENNGVMNIRNSTYDAKSSTDSYLYVYGIYNDEKGSLNLENVSMTGHAYYPIYNVGEDKEEEDGNIVYAVTIQNSTITNNRCNYGLINNGTGTMFINESNINMYQYNDNLSTGDMIIRNSSISDHINNKGAGYIEIDNSNIVGNINNKLNGYILIKGKDTTVVYSIVNSNAEGTIEIQDGTFTNGSTVITNRGNLIISGGTVKQTGGTGYYGISNEAGATATISGENTLIQCQGGGINNVGTLIVENGTIIGTNTRGINNDNTNAILNLGIKDGAVKYFPTVKGKIYGIYNTGTFNFYDGIIEGPRTASIGAILSSTETGSVRVIYEGEYTYDDGTETGYVVPSDREISVLEELEIAYVASTGKKYTTLEDALADTADTDTIQMINDATITENIKSLLIEEGKTITLDLNGKNILAGNSKTFINNGTFNIIDSTSHENAAGDTVEGSIINGSSTILENNGKCTIETGTFGLTVGGTASSYYDIITNTGTLIINEGSFYTNNSYSNIINNSSGDVTVNNGTFITKSSYSNVVRNQTGTMNVNNGVFTAKSSNSKVIINESGIITVNYGILTSENSVEGYVVYNENDGTSNISGGTASGRVYNNGTGIINIAGGDINYLLSTQGAIYNNLSGTINITGGNIKGLDKAIYNRATGTININGTEQTEENPIVINVKQRGSNSVFYSIYNNGAGTVNIKGHVEINATERTNNDYGDAIYNILGTINIGDSEEITNNVKINALRYGISNYTKNYGIINYYGGTITAPIAVYGYISSVPNGYDIKKTENNLNNEVYEIGRMEATATVGGNTYATLDDAISSNTSGTIKLLKDIVLSRTEEQTINNNQNIILDLNGHSIKLHNSETAFYNYGTLKIVDSSESQTGLVYGFAVTAIRNEGNLEIAGGTIKIDQLTDNKIIYNTGAGEVTVTGGTIYCFARESYIKTYAIYTDNANTITVTGGTITIYGSYASNVYAIYTVAEGTTVNISGGNFNSEKNTNGGNTYIVHMNALGTVNLSGDVTSNNTYGISMNKKGTINISENVYLDNGNYSIYAINEEVEININGGTLKKIQGNYKQTVNVRGGEIIGTRGIYFSNAGTSTVNIYEGAKINVTKDAIFNARYVNIYGGTIIGNVGDSQTMTLNMTGGSITGTTYGIKAENKYSQVYIKDGKVTATEGTGILVGNGTLNLGEDTGGYPSTTVPAITGSTYGVTNSGGTFNFYDGILTGGTYATSGTVTNTPEMFTVQYSADGTVAILGITASFEQVAKVNGVYYNDLSSAIEAAIKINGKIEICKDITIDTEVEIPSGSQIAIDLEGFSIFGYTKSGIVFTNNGTLSILDTNDDESNNNIYSSIKSYTGTAIVNNGTLTLGTNDDIVNTNSPRIIGLTTAINNNDILRFFDGQIGTTESGTIVSGEVNAELPLGYELILLGNNYILGK